MICGSSRAFEWNFHSTGTRNTAPPLYQSAGSVYTGMRIRVFDCPCPAIRRSVSDKQGNTRKPDGSMCTQLFSVHNGALSLVLDPRDLHELSTQAGLPDRVYRLLGLGLTLGTLGGRAFCRPHPRCYDHHHGTFRTQIQLTLLHLLLQRRRENLAQIRDQFSCYRQHVVHRPGRTITRGHFYFPFLTETARVGMPGGRTDRAGPLFQLFIPGNHCCSGPVPGRAPATSPDDAPRRKGGGGVTLRAPLTRRPSRKNPGMKNIQNSSRQDGMQGHILRAQINVTPQSKQHSSTRVDGPSDHHVPRTGSGHCTVLGIMAVGRVTPNSEEHRLGRARSTPKIPVELENHRWHQSEGICGGGTDDE